MGKVIPQLIRHQAVMAKLPTQTFVIHTPPLTDIKVRAQVAREATANLDVTAALLELEIGQEISLIQLTKRLNPGETASHRAIKAHDENLEPNVVVEISVAEEATPTTRHIHRLMLTPHPCHKMGLNHLGPILIPRAARDKHRSRFSPPRRQTVLAPIHVHNLFL